MNNGGVSGETQFAYLLFERTIANHSVSYSFHRNFARNNTGKIIVLKYITSDLRNYRRLDLQKEDLNDFVKMVVIFDSHIDNIHFSDKKTGDKDLL